MIIIVRRVFADRYMHCPGRYIRGWRVVGTEFWIWYYLLFYFYLQCPTSILLLFMRTTTFFSIFQWAFLTTKRVKHTKKFDTKAAYRCQWDHSAKKVFSLIKQVWCPQRWNMKFFSPRRHRESNPEPLDLQTEAFTTRPLDHFYINLLSLTPSGCISNTSGMKLHL